jgi:two-component system, NtrC family, sensor kinase
MTLRLLPDLTAAVLNLLFGIYICLRGERKFLHYLFLLLILNVVAWELSECQLILAQTASRAFFWIKVDYCAIFLFPAVFVHFALVFFAEDERPIYWYAVVYIPTLLLMGALLFTDLIVTGVQSRPWGYGSVKGPFYIVFRLYFAGYALLAVSYLVVSIRKAASPIRRVQGKYFLAGLLIPVLFGIVIFNILQPLNIHSLDITVAPLATLFMTGIFTYAAARYRLMGLEVILTRGAAYVLSLVLSAGPLLAIAVWMQKEVFGTTSYSFNLYISLALTVAGLVVSRLALWMQKHVTESLWKRGQSYQDIENDFNQAVVHGPGVPSRQETARSLARVLTESFAPTTVSLLQEAKGLRGHQPGASAEEREAVTGNDPLVLWFREHNGIVVRAELELEKRDESKDRLMAVLAERACEVCVPLKMAGELIGFIAAGNKYGKASYTLEDFRFLSLLADQATIALQNAQLYEDLKRSQQLLARTDRLAAVGTLAAGLAHEIRNPLVSIHTFTQLLPERLDDPEFRATFLPLVSGEVARVSDLINDLMVFARPSPPVIQEVNLHTVLEPIVRLLNGQAEKKGIHLTFSPAASPSVVPADKGQMRQIFMNLLLNALHATPAGGTVSLTVHTPRSRGGKEYCQVVLQDTGAGIPPEYREQIFDPFFTTKDSGAGLGLFIAHQIVAEHGGYIDVESVVGKGTSFYVYLPSAQSPRDKKTGLVPDGEWVERTQVFMVGAGKR